MRIRKNESSATARTMPLFVRDLDGVPAEPDAVTTSMLVYDDGSGTTVAATGTLAPVTKPLVLADDTFTADAGTDVITFATNDPKTGDGPLRFTTTGGLPGGTLVATDYYWVRTGTKTGKIASSRANALAGTTIDITSAGTGTHTASDTAGTRRCVRGAFTYTFTQAETDVSANHIAIIVEDDTVQTVWQTAFVHELEMDRDANVGGATYGDLQRGQIAILGGPVLDFTTNTYVFRDPWTLVTRWTGTVGPTGRLTITPGDLT